jgi:hypothetical protein
MLAASSGKGLGAEELSPVPATWDIRSEKAAIRKQECAYTDCKWMCTEEVVLQQ